MEGRDVENSYIPGAFIHTHYDRGDIHIKMEGGIVTLLEDTAPNYYKEFIYLQSRGRKCLYAESQKAVYGTLEASLLF